MLAASWQARVVKIARSRGLSLTKRFSRALTAADVAFQHDWKRQGQEVIEPLETILHTLLDPQKGPSAFSDLKLDEQLDRRHADDAGMAQALNAAFLIAMAGPEHRRADQAFELLEQASASAKWHGVAEFYGRGVERVRRELKVASGHDADFASRLHKLSAWVSGNNGLAREHETVEKTWPVFFPEATGIRGHESDRVAALRAKRRVRIRGLNPKPLSDPAGQILFTSNVLLTLPDASKPLDEFRFDKAFASQLRRACDEPQLYWYDHPIQIGIDPAANEVLYGLRGLQAALEFEQQRGNAPRDTRLSCVLSVSVTHHGLQHIAKPYLVDEIVRYGGFENLDIFLFTDADAKRIVEELLVPAAEHYLGRDDARDLLDMFGVDGPYGRHYSFLKAIAALWQVLVDSKVAATFKIDLDQVFPQQALVGETGLSAWEHFTTPLWGARGVDADGHAVELGMIAGALVNERDLANSLFTPDVAFPSHPLAADEYVFFSPLPQALSTEAEMMARYNTTEFDGRTHCLERVHVTGGTNGILIDSLRRHRPFTPSFIGRAEDQAYLLSTFPDSDDRLAYVHQPGLVMRHDKQAFAQQAISAAHVGKMIGDYVRILYFSAYGRAVAADVRSLKAKIDPFTGCFVSRIPETVVHLRFALKAASLFVEGNERDGLNFVTLGTRRITEALDFTSGDSRKLAGVYEQQRRGWDLYYEILTAIEQALQRGDAFAVQLHARAQGLVTRCSTNPGAEGSTA